MFDALKENRELRESLKAVTAELNSAKAEIERCKASSVMDGFAIIDLQRQVAELKGLVAKYLKHIDEGYATSLRSDSRETESNLRKLIEKLTPPDQKE